MKKNVIFLLIDCFDYNKIGANEFRPSPTPFLDELKHKTLWAERMYSHAPYTEAALIATICGYDTLDYGGHLKRYKNCPETLYEMMHNAGYEVYAQMWTHFYPSSALKGIDIPKLRPYSFKTLWYYRFEYYSGLYVNNQMEDADYRDLEDIIRDNFIHWKQYLIMLENHDERIEMIDRYMILPDMKDNISKLQNEINIFDTNPRMYIESIFQQGLNHKIFEIFDDECLNNKVDPEFVKKIHEKYNYLNKYLYDFGNKLNRQNNHLSFRKMWQYYKGGGYSLNLNKRTQISQYLRNYWHVTHDTHLLGKFKENYPDQKDCITARSMMELFLDWQDKRNEQAKPYFAYIHCDDIHGQSEIFNVCSTVESEIDDQVKELSLFLKNIKKNYRGNLAYDLGLISIDRQVKWFYGELEKRGLLENSIFIITADHGCGTNYYPLRGMIQNFHDECYHIPFIICGNCVKPKVDTNYHMTKDIMPTIADLVDAKLPNSATGISLFSKKERKIVIQEYMGPGCPDMYRREAWMCAFDDEWKLFIKVKLNKEKGFDYKIEEIFNRRQDPLELDNRKWNKKDVRECDYLFKALEVRWKEIISNYSRDGKY